MNLLAIYDIPLVSEWCLCPRAEIGGIRNIPRCAASVRKRETVWKWQKSFTEIMRDHPTNIASLMYLGQTLFKEEKFAAAIIPYEKVRALEKTGTKLSLTQQRILRDQLAMAYG